MRIAVIGGGISGMGAALALSELHDVMLFEQAERLGGHANTTLIDYPLAGGGTREIAVDTGFIVFNEKTYPNLVPFFEMLGVPVEWSDMSLSFSVDGGRLEWAADDLDKIFGQRENLLRPRFIGALLQVLRFNRTVRGILASGEQVTKSIGDWLDEQSFNQSFRNLYLYPMAGAIWSMPNASIADFPAAALFRFYENHDLLVGMGDAVQWKTVTGGSREYVARAAAALGDRLRLGAGVSAVKGGTDGATVAFADGTQETFDAVVIATHSDEALALRTDADAETRALLGAIRYSRNRAVLHRDASLMPKREKVWSSWNTVEGEGSVSGVASVTYWMNRLQNIDTALPLFVSLNPARMPDASLVFGAYDYAHPIFDGPAMAAQAAFDTVQGRGNVWHAGAWLGYGFHEDGLRSGVRVAAALGARPDWARDIGAPMAAPASG